MTLLRHCLHAAYGVWAALAFVGVTIPTLALLAVTPGLMRRRTLTHNAARLVFALIGQRPAVSGADRLPREQCVVTANHASYVDGILLTAVLPPRFTFVIKKEMTGVPLAHFLLRRVGSQFVDRSDRHRGALDVRRILHQAGRNESLVFFPEGTFTAEQGLRRFHLGAFATAVRSQTPLVPVTIRGTRAMLPSDQWLPRPARISVVILPALEPAQGPGAAPKLMQDARAAILANLDEPDLAPD